MSTRLVSSIFFFSSLISALAGLIGAAGAVRNFTKRFLSSCAFWSGVSGAPLGDTGGGICLFLKILTIIADLSLNFQFATYPLRHAMI